MEYDREWVMRLVTEFQQLDARQCAEALLKRQEQQREAAARCLEQAKASACLVRARLHQELQTARLAAAEELSSELTMGLGTHGTSMLAVRQGSNVACILS
eukprot:g31559.t1